MITKQQLKTLHAIQAAAVEAGDLAIYYAIDLAISAALKIAPQYHVRAVDRAVEHNRPS